MFRCCAKKRNNVPSAYRWSSSALDTVETETEDTVEMEIDIPVIGGFDKYIVAHSVRKPVIISDIEGGTVHVSNSGTSPLRIAYTAPSPMSPLNGFSDSDFSENDPLLCGDL